jgi:tetratricopeptide (TPR) repeat protein
MKEELLSAASSTASVKSNKPNKQRTKVLPIMTACFALAVIFGLTAVLSGPKQPEQATSMDTRGHEDSLEMAAMDALSHAQMAMWRMERERDRVRAQRAIDEFEKYLTRMDRMPGRQWRVESMRGTYHQLEGNNAKALSYFESALVHHKQYAHNECEKDALRLAIGQCQHATGQHKEAEQTYLKLLSDIRHRLAGSADTKLWQDGPLRYLIQHYGSTNNYDRALWASSELFDLYRKYRPTSDDAIPAQAYYGCYLARSGKNLNEGIKQLEQALAKQKAFYKRKPEAQVISFYFTILADLATAYELRGDKAKAERMRIVVGALTNDALQNKLPSPDSLEF